jgi:hypothetical protein
MELKYTRALLPGMFFDYDCVIIPGFGGFVCNERPAWYDDEKEEIVPPSRDVLFNPNLTHNDGLLAQEIIRSTGVTYSEAMKLAENESQFIASELKLGNSVEIAGVGRLYSGEDGVNRFAPDAELVRTLSSFGHSRIPLMRLQTKQVSKPTEDKKEPVVVTMVPLSKKLARVAAILALPIAAVAIIGGTYIAKESNGSNTLLSLFPSPEAIISTFSPSENSSLVDFEEIEEKDINIEYVEPEPEPEEEKEVVIRNRVVNFLIVGGAFAVEENAHTLADELRDEGYNPTFHFQNHNKLHLVALGEFEKEAEARRAMAKARRSGRKASWLKKLR